MNLETCAKTWEPDADSGSTLCGNRGSSDDGQGDSSLNLDEGPGGPASGGWLGESQARKVRDAREGPRREAEGNSKRCSKEEASDTGPTIVTSRFPRHHSRSDQGTFQTVAIKGVKRRWPQSSHFGSNRENIRSRLLSVWRPICICTLQACRQSAHDSFILNPITS